MGQYLQHMGKMQPHSPDINCAMTDCPYLTTMPHTLEPPVPVPERNEIRSPVSIEPSQYDVNTWAQERHYRSEWWYIRSQGSEFMLTDIPLALFSSLSSFYLSPCFLPGYKQKIAVLTFEKWNFRNRKNNFLQF